jgi:hypothetical protein
MKARHGSFPVVGAMGLGMLLAASYGAAHVDLSGTFTHVEDSDDQIPSYRLPKV